MRRWKKEVDSASEASRQHSEVSHDRLLYCVVGLHALTVPQDPKVFSENRYEMLASLLALGLNTKQSKVFFQEDVREHTELAWYLTCIASANRLFRMTQWKAKAAQLGGVREEDFVVDGTSTGTAFPMGLLSYPLLMAADILLYKTTHVPVGEDQVQHLELAAYLAQKFNTTFGVDVFPVPQVELASAAARVASLKDPTKKMSKSDRNASSKILLTDAPKVIEKRIRGAVTDDNTHVSWDPTGRPGMSNLLSMYACLHDCDPADVVHLFPGDRGVQRLKAGLAEAIIEALRPFRDEFPRLMDDRAYLGTKQREGADYAASIARDTMSLVRRVQGL